MRLRPGGGGFEDGAVLAGGGEGTLREILMDIRPHGSWVQRGGGGAGRLGCWALVLGLGLSALGVGGGELEGDLQELKRTPPTPPDQALGTFQVRPGYQLELVAAEPLVVDPIALSFDEEGRLYVLEMIDYSERRPEMLGQVRRLEDTDGDGRFDRGLVVAKGLPWPTGVLWAEQAVWVAATPDIVRCRDLDGDGVADQREVVFTGFGIDYAPYETNRLNVQAMLNSLLWGVDNRIHGATSFNGGRVTTPFHPGRPAVDLRGRDFSFEPRGLDLRGEVGGGQYGMSMDDSGRKFLCSNSDHIQAVMYEDRYAARNPAFNAPPPRVSIAADGPAATVFRISPDEPWRVIRTRWRVAGVRPGLIEGGGRASGYFTSATGLTVYRGDAWPDADRGDVFIADCGSNLVHRKKVRSRGVEWVAERAADEQEREFLACTDVWFRPVQFANGPDGSLYVIDMYREIIEHPWSLPEPLKSQLDLNAGNDRGRLYRLAPEGFVPPPRVSLGAATTAELVLLLTHPNGWHRDTAARLLSERRDPQAIPALRRLVADRQGQTRPPEGFTRGRATSALKTGAGAGWGRVHALQVLSAQGALEVEGVMGALEDPVPEVRRHAIRLAERWLGAADVPSQLVERLLARAGDPDPWVRYQLAFALGEVAHPGRVAAMVALLRRDHEDRWVRAALLTSLGTGAAEMLVAVVGDEGLRGTDSGREFLRQLVEVIGAQDRVAELEVVVERLAADEDLGMDLLGAFGTGLGRKGRSLASVDAEGRLQALFERAPRLAQDPTQPEGLRVRAVRVVAMGSVAQAAAVLPRLLEPAQPQAVQLAALSAWVRYTDPAVGRELVDRWAGMTPRVRSEALAALLARPERVALLLDAVEQEKIHRADIPSTDADSLRRHRDEAVRARAVRLLAAPASREDVVKQFEAALTLAGAAGRALTNFQARCASCHRLGGEGYAVGPDLETVRATGRDKMLTAILDPNRDVQPNYQAYEIETREDESLLGLVAAETATAVTLRRAYGEQTVIPRTEIVRMQGRGVSLMPEGLEAGLTAQDLADLLELILSGPPPR